MTSHGGLLGRLRPRSFRAWTAIGMVGSLILIVIVQAVLSNVLQADARTEVERTLQEQATAVLSEVLRAPRNDRDGAARRAATLLSDTRVLVREGGTTIFWSRPSGATYAQASAQAEAISVTLERVDPISAIGRGRVFGTTAIGLGLTGLAVWFVSGGIALRLRDRLRKLSDSASRIAAGHLDERAQVTDDEVGRVAASFNRMASQLERDEQRQRNFLADIAHELRTPVTAIEGFASALQDGTARSEEDRREAAGFIRDEAARMREMVREFQELTWLDLDPPIRAVPTDLAELARTAVARQAAAAADRGVALAGPDGNVPIISDPDHLTTVLANLISNALKATPSGGTVTVGAEAKGGDAVLTVSDTGIGIPAEHLPYLFDRLFRVNAARVRDGDSGSGLGLSIVKRLTVLLDARISVASTVGSGTTFTVWLLGARSAARAGAAGGAA